jgi:hypothetical protein
MTDSEQLDPRLVAVIRSLVQAMAEQTEARPRTSRSLSGVVEHLDPEELDVVWARMDGEAMMSDPYESDNYEVPGVIPSIRLGNTLPDEQVRLLFDGANGATATHTGVESRIILPFGATEGVRILLDGELGVIVFFDRDDDLVGLLEPQQWSIGKPGWGLLRLDPVGGLRIRDSEDRLRAILSPTEGLNLRNPDEGTAGCRMNHEGLTLQDPVSGDQIQIVAGGLAAAPEPRWRGSEATTPGASHTTPAMARFTALHVKRRCTAASAAANLGSQSYSMPASYTERSNVNNSGGGLTLASSVATRHGAVNGDAGTFTNTSSAFTRQNGHTVVVRGDGPSQATVRDVEVGPVVQSTDATIPFTVDAPSAVDHDFALACVSITSDRIPVGWTTPDGWQLLGAQVSGIGTSHICASGVWFAHLHDPIPAFEELIINMGSSGGLTKVQATVVTIANPFHFPAGVDIRRNNVSMPRGLLAALDVPAFGPVDVTTVVPDTTVTLSLRAGRTYSIEFIAPAAQLATFQTSNVWTIRLQRNGSDFPGASILSRHKMGGQQGGSMITGGGGKRVYVPDADETSTWRIRLHRTIGSESTMELTGLSHFVITDIGAVF